MGKEDKRENMGKVYREFSRQKYNKYKHQFPKMRESEIVSKIIREWDSLDIQGKEKLQLLYENNRFLIKQDLSESEPAKRELESNKLVKVAIVKEEEHPTAAKTPVKEQADKLNENLESNREISVENIQGDSSIMATPPPKAKKAGSKTKKNDYVNFFKYYYDKYSKEHPKWTSMQISKVIKLLWMKRKKQYKLSVPKKGRKTKSEKPLSGKRLFRKIKKLSSDDFKKQWKHLPRQSKLLWCKKNQPTVNEQSKIESKVVLKSSISSPLAFNSIFGFLGNPIT